MCYLLCVFPRRCLQELPTEEDLCELTYAGKFAGLRKAANSIQRDLKNRFMKKDVFEKFDRAKVSDSVQKGMLHDKDTLFGEHIYAPQLSSLPLYYTYYTYHT